MDGGGAEAASSRRTHKTADVARVAGPLVEASVSLTVRRARAGAVGPPVGSLGPGAGWPWLPPVRAESRLRGCAQRHVGGGGG